MPRKKKDPKPDQPKPPPKKRGRKPKKKDPASEVPKIPKKRGRKPKGGKIIKKENLKKDTDKNIQHNIILHFTPSNIDTLHIMPPLLVEYEHIDKLFEALDSIFSLNFARMINKFLKKIVLK